MEPEEAKNNGQKYDIYKKIRFVYVGFRWLNRVILWGLAGLLVFLIIDTVAGKDNSFISSAATSIIMFVMVILPLYVVIIILRFIFWRKYGYTYQNFSDLRKDIRSHPDQFRVQPTAALLSTRQESKRQPRQAHGLEGTNREPGTIACGKKVVRQRVGAVAGLVSLILLALIAAIAQKNINTTPESGSTKSNSQNIGSSKTSQSKTLSGRWESTNGQTAMIFKGSTVYMGNKYNSDSDLIAECKSWGKGIASYSIDGSKIVFTYKNQTSSGKYSNSIIYFDGESLKKVD